MHLATTAVRARLDAICAVGLLSPGEADDVARLFDPSFPYAALLAAAESVHLHVRVDDVASVRSALDALGDAENEKSGYVKLRSPDGVHLIVSSIDIADDDRVATLPRRPRPHLDHVGLDVRDDSPRARALFDAVPEEAARGSWRTAHQGGPGQAVFCCHTSVAEKRWLYPPSCASVQTIVEIALGPLRVGDGMGCDLRPLDPKLAAVHATNAACCATPAPAPVALGRKPAHAG